MAIIILHRASLTSAPYHQWLSDAKEPLFLIVSQAKLDAFGESLDNLPEGAYAQTQAVDKYDTNGTIELAVLAIAKIHKITAIVAQAEFDIERAARLREHLHVQGQSVNSATAYRDKIHMKFLTRKAGIAVADWKALSCIDDLYSFIDIQGYPVVIKPRNGAGSVGVNIIKNQNDLDIVIDKGFSPPVGIKPNMMVEAFVPGRTYHVDGLVINGQPVMVWPSIYTTESLDFQQEGGEPVASYLLSPENPLTSRLQQFVLGLLSALPTPLNTTFHAEVFHTPEDQLVLCEIASRNGGVRIVDGIAAGFDVNIGENWARAECCLIPKFTLPDTSTLLKPKRQSGWTAVAPRSGVVRRLPITCDLPSVIDYRISVKIGDVLSKPKAATESIASFVFVVPDENKAQILIDECRSWFLENSHIDNNAIKCLSTG